MQACCLETVVEVEGKIVLVEESVGCIPRFPIIRLRLSSHVGSPQFQPSVKLIVNLKTQYLPFGAPSVIGYEITLFMRTCLIVPAICGCPWAAFCNRIPSAYCCWVHICFSRRSLASAKCWLGTVCCLPLLNVFKLGGNGMGSEGEI